LSRKRCRSPTTSVPAALPVPGALSPVCTDLLPPRKRIRDSDFMNYFEVSLEEGFVPYVPRETDIDTCIAFADDIAARGTDVIVEIGTATEDESDSSARGTIEIERGLDVVMQELYDHMLCTAMSEMISTLERDNMRIRGMLGVERQRVDRDLRLMLGGIWVIAHRFVPL
ncbi:hypothetical protein Tco_0774725, partial [Tanacetum coccineum]